MPSVPQMVTGLTYSDLRYRLTGPIDDCIAALTSQRDEAVAKGWHNLRIDIEAYDDYGSSSCSVLLMGDRMETQQEADRRTESEYLRKISNEKRERQQLAALRAKYG